MYTYVSKRKKEFDSEKKMDVPLYDPERSNIHPRYAKSSTISRSFPLIENLRLDEGLPGENIIIFVLDEFTLNFHKLAIFVRH